MRLHHLVHKNHYPVKEKNKMNELNQVATMRKGILLHCGATVVSEDEVANVITPEPTKTWFPIPHHTLVDTVMDSMQNMNMRVKKCTHSLSHEGMRYFGVFELEHESRDGDYAWVLGLRNSHDQKFSAGLVAGTQVFVCDNLAFAGEIKFSRKHTPRILHALPRIAASTIHKLSDKFIDMDRRIECYKNTELTDVQAHDTVINLLDHGAITTTQIPKILQEWRSPMHDCFKDRNVWSLFNGVTEHYKEVSPATMVPRSARLHAVLDSVAKVSW